MISHQALAELALCLSLALAIVCVGEPIRHAAYLNPWSSYEAKPSIEPSFKDASVTTSFSEPTDIKLMIPSSTGYFERPLDTPSLDSLEQARVIEAHEPPLMRIAFADTQPVFFRSYSGTPATVASYHLKDARKLPLYEVELQAGRGERRRRMTPITRRRREATLARLAMLESQPATSELEETHLEKRGRTPNASQVRYAERRGRQLTWAPKATSSQVKSTVDNTAKKEHAAPSEQEWNPRLDPVHNGRAPQWEGPRAPGQPLPSPSQSTKQTVPETAKRYNGELEETLRQLKSPKSSWANVAARPQAEVLFPSFAQSYQVKQPPIASPSKGKEVVVAPSAYQPVEPEVLSKDGYRFSSSSRDYYVKREAVEQAIVF